MAGERSSRMFSGGTAASYPLAVKCIKPGGKIGSIISIADDDKIVLSGAEFTGGMSNKQIVGAGMWTGRNKIGKCAALMAAGKLDTSLLVTHVYHGWDELEDALQIMTDKPDELIKPVVIIEE